MPGPALNDRMVVMKYKILLVDDDRALLKMLSNFRFFIRKTLFPSF